MVTKRLNSKGFQLRIIPQFVGLIFNEIWPKARKEKRITLQASAGDPLSMNSLLAIRQAERGQDQIYSEKSRDSPAKAKKRYMPHDRKQSRHGGIFFRNPEIKGLFHHSHAFTSNELGDDPKMVLLSGRRKELLELRFKDEKENPIRR